MSTTDSRRFWVVALVLALLVAGGLSLYASSHPDGLEYVAEQVGFADAAEDSAVAEGPMADYETKGIAHDSASRGLAGVVGALVVLTLTGLLMVGLRRRRPTSV